MSTRDEIAEGGIELPPAPERIYLQYNDNPNDSFSWTWCADKINDGDIEYVRADALLTERARIIRACGGCGHVFMDDDDVEVVCVQARPCPDHEPSPKRSIMLGVAIMVPIWALALWWWLG